MPPNNGALALADGSIFLGSGFGFADTAIGEICFNTSMSGYQEILTDPSYFRQIIVFTSPHIGNTGCNPHDNQSNKHACCGVIQRCTPTTPSNWQANISYAEWLQKQRIVGLAGIDTRSLTLHIREKGMQPAAIINQINGTPDTKKLLEAARSFNGLDGAELAMQVTTDKYIPRNKKTGKHIVVVDFGVKQNILEHLSAQGLAFSIVPANTNFQNLMKLKPDGILLSNGPGDPKATAQYAAPMIRSIVKINMPILAICLGHQLLAISLGAKTRKMTQGHHGSNHPVKNLQNNSIEICSMNHGFTVNSDSLPANITQSHTSLFDNSNCGISIQGKPILSVQHHPEAAPGPSDASTIFARFAHMLTQNY